MFTKVTWARNKCALQGLTARLHVGRDALWLNIQGLLMRILVDLISFLIVPGECLNMRLLHSKTLEFEEFFDSDIPKYAILSHRWEGKEMSFQEFQDDNKRAHPGFAKIQSCCSIAQRRKLDWVWIDICCIDKKSSAELTEAINSMYRWYEKAVECYAYLNDFSLAGPDQVKDWKATRMSFQKSAWFTRGWTLQELLAPYTVIFFDRAWNSFGSKDSLAAEVSSITGIEVDHLTLARTRSVTVAQKMSWASKRKTSRIEDIAYCLLGIFDVNMPLLYGEGMKAFMRLQLEIIKRSNDESIFAWTAPFDAFDIGLLALTPLFFSNSQDIQHEPYESKFYDIAESRPYSMTNKGLELYLPRSDFNVSMDEVALILNCCKHDSNDSPHIKIKLCRVGRRWRRIDCGSHILSSRSVQLKGLYKDSIESHDTMTIYVTQPGM